MKKEYITLTQNERMILQSYIPVVQGLGQYLGEGYEVILHNLESLEHSVMQIVNGHHSGRKIGAPITDLALGMLSQIKNSKDHSAISYFNRRQDGVILKSTTIPIPGEGNRIIGMICINFYTNIPLSTVIQQMIPEDLNSLQSFPHTTETFTENVDDLIEAALADVKDQILNDTSISTNNKNKEIVTALYKKGIFNLKDSVIKVADRLNISKNTVYMHIRNLKNELPE